MRTGSRPPAAPDRLWVAPERTGFEAEDAAAPAPAAPARPDRGSWREGGPGDGGWSDRPPPAEPPPLPVPLTAMTVTDVLDGAWAVLSCRPRTVLALSALIIVPAEVVAALLVGTQGQGVSPADAASRVVPFLRIGPGVSLLDVDVAALVAMAVLTLAYTVLGAAMGRLVVAWYDDTDLPVGAVLRPLVGRLPALAVAAAVMFVLQGLSIVALVLPALFAIPLLMLVGPVIGIERRGPFAAVGRSARLVSRRYAAVVWIWVVSLAVERLVAAVVALVPELLAALVPAGLAPVLRASGWALAQFLTAPVVAALAVLVFLDLRIRTEGLDLLVEAREVFPEAADD